MNPNRNTWACSSCGWTWKNDQSLVPSACYECGGKMVRLDDPPVDKPLVFTDQTTDQEPDMPENILIPAELAPRFVDFLACEARARHDDERVAGTTWRDAMDVYAMARHRYDARSTGQPLAMELGQDLRRILESPKGVNAPVAAEILALLWEPSDDARAAAQKMLGPRTRPEVVDARLREMYAAGYQIVKR